MDTKNIKITKVMIIGLLLLMVGLFTRAQDPYTTDRMGNSGPVPVSPVVTGQIVSVDSMFNEIKVRDDSGTSRTYSLERSVIFAKNGDTISANGLNPGNMVSMEIRSGNRIGRLTVIQ